MPYQNWPLPIYQVLLLQTGLLELATVGLFLGSKSTGDKASTLFQFTLTLKLVYTVCCYTAQLTSL